MTEHTEPAPVSVRRMPAWLLGTIAGVFALVFAYAVWNAIGNLVAAVGAAAGTGLRLNALGWFIWIFAAIFPVIVYAVAFVIARRRRAATALLVFLSGLALVAVFWLDVVAYTALYTQSFYS
jgi:hypothetical protein